MNSKDAHTTPSHLIIIDADLPDKHLFKAAQASDTVVVEIDRHSDGLDQLVDVLSQFEGLQSLHILSHASEGTIFLGDAPITEQTLRQHPAIFATFDAAMADGGDVLFYGCDLAADESGQALLTLLASRANVDVAASTDATGAAALGGNWAMEFSTGGIEAQSPITALATQQFTGLLSGNSAPVVTGVPGVITLLEDEAVQLDLSGVKITDADGDLITLTLSVDAGNLSAAAEFLGTQAGVTTSQVDAQSITLVGSATDISAALDGTNIIEYAGESNAFGSNAATLSVAVEDSQDSIGTAANATISITGVNDAPVVTLRSFVEWSIVAAGAFGHSAPWIQSIDTIEGEALSSVTLQILGLQNSDQDEIIIDGSWVPVTTTIGATNASGGNLAYAVSYSAGVSTITLTGAGGGTLPLGFGNFALDYVTYEDTSSGTRIFTATEVVDAGGTANGGENRWTNNESTIQLTLFNPNDPRVSDALQASSEDVQFQLSPLKINPVMDTVDSDALEYITLSAINGGTLFMTGTPTGGTATDSSPLVSKNTALSAGDKINLADITLVQFTPELNSTSDASIVYTATDAGGDTSVPATFTITLAAVNDPPTDIDITAASINTSETDINTEIGTLSTIDVDSNAFTYSLVSGAGDDDNALFNIDGDSLRTNAGTAPGSYGVRINTNDGDIDFSEAFTITVINDLPTVTDGNIALTSSGRGSGGTYIIGDTVTALWNNTAGGDNNNDIASVTVDFSAFGGGATVAAANSAGTWTASYTLTSASIDANNLNILVTATDSNGKSKSTADSSNVSVDLIAPEVSDNNIEVSGDSDGTFIIGDTVSVAWDNTDSGDDNADIAAATVDFSAFGGGAAVAASNSGGVWTATYTLTQGFIDSTNLNVALTATDNSGNSSTTADSSNSSVDTRPPQISTDNTSLSGASGTDGTFIAGDTVSVTWNNTASGNNNPDITSVMVDLSAFGGGNTVAALNTADSWTATYTLTGSEGISGDNLNVSVLAIDDASNATSIGGNNNASVDSIRPTLSGFSSTTPDGSYSVGDSISLTATLSEPVAAGSGITVTLDTGATVALSTGTASDTLTGTYVVSVGEISADLAVNSFAIDSVIDAAGNTMITTTVPAANLASSSAIAIINSAPTVTGAPSSIGSILEDSLSDIDLSDLTFSDVENDALTITLTVNSGLFAEPANGDSVGDGVTAIKVDNTTLSLSGSASDINSYLDNASNIRYTGAENAYGDNAATLTLGAADSASSLTTDPEIALNIIAVNDRPTLQGTATLTQTEDAPATALNLSNILVADVDSASDIVLTLNIADTSANLTAVGAGGAVSDVEVEQVNAYTVTLTGTMSELNTYLASNGASDILYTTRLNGDKNDELSIVANDGSLDSLTKPLTITVAAVDDAPSDIGLSAASINQSQGADSTVGVLSSTDVDSSSYTYTLISGAGDDDNALFRISGNSLIANDATAMAPGDYTVRVNTNDGSNDYAKAFVITVVDDIDPTVADSNIRVSGASGSDDTFVTGDTVSVQWDNTASGDNNTDIDSVTVDFSAFGGGAFAAANNTANIWSATYTLTEGHIDAEDINVALTATDSAGNASRTVDSSDNAVDNETPSLSTDAITLSGASGTDGIFIIGDRVSVTWDNSSTTGDGNDDIVSVIVDLSAFGGPPIALRPAKMVAIAFSAATYSPVQRLLAATV